jgi:hypothetical protein
MSDEVADRRRQTYSPIFSLKLACYTLLGERREMNEQSSSLDGHSVCLSSFSFNGSRNVPASEQIAGRFVLVGERATSDWKQKSRGRWGQVMIISLTG